jgi:hypothetical protein
MKKLLLNLLSGLAGSILMGVVWLFVLFQGNIHDNLSTVQQVILFGALPVAFIAMWAYLIVDTFRKD